MHSKSDNIDLSINDKADEVTEDIFESLLCRYQKSLKESIKVSDFISDYIHLLHFKCYKINSILGGSYIDSPDWRKNKKAANPINKDDNKCYQYIMTLALRHEEIEKHSGRISKIKPFVDINNWKDIDYLSGKDKWIKLRKIVKQLLSIVLYTKKEKKYRLHFEKQLKA